MKEKIKENKLKTIYSDLTIRLVHLAKIKRLISENIRLRVSYGYNTLWDEEMIIISQEMYNRFIKKRIRDKAKKRKSR